METRIIHELINQRVILQYLSMLIIPTYNAITLLIVFYASLSISSNTAPIWLITTIISISIYYMWSLPLRVWVLQVWFPHTTKKDIITLHRVLAVRTKSILRRFHGLLFAGMTVFVVQNTCMIRINCYDIIITLTLLYTHHHYHRCHHLLFYRTLINYNYHH